MEDFITGILRDDPLDVPAGTLETAVRLLGGLSDSYRAPDATPELLNASNQAGVNSYLLEEIWEHIAAWTKKELRYDVPSSPCPIRTASGAEMSSLSKTPHRKQPPLGMYAGRKRGILIRDDVMGNTPQCVVVLTHEYMHFIHDQIVDEQDRRRCPKIFSEGLAEAGTRAFCRRSGYWLPSEYRTVAFTDWYDKGLRLVQQISVQEKYGLDGFCRTFLNNLDANNPWHQLDPFFA